MCLQPQVDDSITGNIDVRWNVEPFLMSPLSIAILLLFSVFFCALSDMNGFARLLITNEKMSLISVSILSGMSDVAGHKYAEISSPWFDRRIRQHERLGVFVDCSVFPGLDAATGYFQVFGQQTSVAVCGVIVWIPYGYGWFSGCCESAIKYRSKTEEREKLNRI